MNKTLKIKVCGMKFPENIAQVADLGVDYLGFIFYPKSPRHMADALSRKDMDAIPARVKKVGVFVNENKETILKHAEAFNLNVIQLHGSETPEFCATIKQHKLEIFKAFSVDQTFDKEIINPYEESIDYALLDTKTKAHGGSGRKFDWSILENIKTKKPLILSGGIGPDDAEEIKRLEHINIEVLDLNSRFEDEPGLKNIDKLKRFLSKLDS